MSKWLKKNQIIRKNAIHELDEGAPRFRYPEIEPLTTDHINAVYRIIEQDNEPNFKKERNLLIFEVFLYSGIRHKEFRQLRKTDIGKDYIHIIDGKG